MKFFINGLNEYINIKIKCEILDNKRVSKVINISFARKFKMSSVDICNKLHIDMKICPFCGEFIPPNYYDVSINDNVITINGGIYVKEFSSCRNKQCHSKKLNPNSVEFVSVAYGLSEEDALKYIHERNKSPFYRENHVSEEDYTKYQKRDIEWYKSRGKDIKESVTLGNYHKSLEFYKLKYGEIDGEEIYNSINDRKRITLSNMIKVHGEEKGTLIYEDWKKKVVQTPERMVARYGKEEGICRYKEFLKKKMSNVALSSNLYENLDGIFESKDILFDFLYKRLHITKQYYITEEYIEKYIYYDSSVVQFIVSYMFNNKEEFYNQFKEYVTNINPIKDRCIFISKQTMGTLFLTYDGNLLRSSLEYHFYNEMCKNHIDNILFYTDRVYPNQEDGRFRYDFYFPDFEEYVEIAGMMDIDEYKSKLLTKKELFSPIILYTLDDITKYVSDLAIRYKQLENNLCR